MRVNSLLSLIAPFIKPESGDNFLRGEEAQATWASAIYLFYKFRSLNQTEEIRFWVVKMLELHEGQQFT